MNGISSNATKRALVILLVVIIAGAIAQVVYINTFNQQVHTVIGENSTQATYMNIHDRRDSTSQWVKRGYALHGNAVDLLAQTIDGTLHNNSTDTVNSWQLTLTINGDCFINNAWCGKVEIHQYVGTDKESVQTLDLRAYNLEDVKLDYLYDGDLLIPLQKGDYLIYYPSEKDDELVIAPNSELTMGMIFYYLDTLDLSNYELSYQYHRDYTHGPSFIAICVLAIIWVLLFLAKVVADASYRRAKTEMDLRTSGLACMSDLYSIICFIDLETDELIPVHAEEESVAKMPKGSGAREKTLAIFGQDTTEPYRKKVLEFVDIATLPQRLKDDSISCEYVSKVFGWSEVRFFAVDRDEEKPLKRVLLTIQDINDKKSELDRFEERAAQAELENKMRSVLAADVAGKMKPSIEAILELDERILVEDDKEAMKQYAQDIKLNGRALEYMIDSAVDSAMIAAGTMEANREEYSLAALTGNLCQTISMMVESKNISFTTDISPSTPDQLIGDAARIERALIGLFSAVGNRMDSGTVKFSLYGKNFNGVAHLLFSVHADGFKLSESEMNYLSGFLANLEENGYVENTGELHELDSAAMLLAFMGSSLHAVYGPNEEFELYFEIDQEIKE